MNAFKTTSVAVYFLICMLIESECALAGDRRVRSIAPQREVVCENRIAHLKCGDGELIRIIKANYGRTANTVCIDGRKDTQKWDLKCKSINSLNVVKERCQDKHRCAIDAKNIIFGDPCVGTEKYLEIEFECFAAPETKHALACEKSVLHLECPIDKFIEIVSASYGRTDSTVCENNKKFEISCVQPNTINIVSDRCKQKHSCKVEANNKLFGDPCKNTQKYLEVYYKCIDQVSTDSRDAGSGKVHNAIACEDTSLDISCSNNTNILIQYALYGRSEKHHCANGQRTDKWSIQCGARNSVEVVSDRCDFKKKCSIPADNDVFGDPCSGTKKYLEVQYTCEAFPTRHVATACEGSALQLECPEENSVIRIQKANYGRMDRKTCRKEGRESNINCFAMASLNLLQMKCDNEKSCKIDAKNTVFGDPCLGTYKYLEVHYECLDLSSLIDVRFGEDTTDNNGVPL